MIPAQRDRRRKNMVFSGTCSPTSASISAGSPTQQLTVTAKNGFGATVSSPLHAITYASSNTGVCTVNGTGLITRVAAGSANIIIRSGRMVLSIPVTSS